MLSRLTILAAALAAPHSVQLRAAPPARPAAARATAAPTEQLVKVAIETNAGRMVVALDRCRAPITVANFLRYVDTHRYDGQGFYRAMPYTKGGLIQAGITTDARKLFPPIADEPTSKTGLHNVRGALSMARADAGTARSDFFILTEDIPAFDGAPNGDSAGFSAFGHVIEGMDVADQIFRAPTSPTKGAGVMKGQMLDPVVRIVRMSRVPG